MPRGGRRSGTLGHAYPNRTDMHQPVRTAPGQQYGQATQQANAQKAIPLPAAAPVQASPAPVAPSPAPDPGMLHAPSTRPGEPVTAGLPVGAGPGTEALQGPVAPGAQDDQILANLYAAYRANPTEGLRALIEQTERLRAPAY